MQKTALQIAALALCALSATACRQRPGDDIGASGVKEFTAWEDYKHPEYVDKCGASGGGSGLSLADASPQAAIPVDLGPQVAALFKAKHCNDCHNPQSSDDFGVETIPDILDAKAMVTAKVINTAAPATSRLYKKMANNSMPKAGWPGAQPGDKAIPLSDAEKALVLNWITAGAPDLIGSSANEPAPSVPANFISEPDKILCMAKDLGKIPAADRAFTRYLTMTHLVNAGVGDIRLGIARDAVTKALNSLSWMPGLSRPVVIDPAKSILRFDLRTYGWTEQQWQKIVAADPYAIVLDQDDAKALYKLGSTAIPFVRADWFVEATTKPPLYHDLGQIPSTDVDLEKLLGVSVLTDIDQFKVVRAGFVSSGVSANNRLIERHDEKYGTYWKSYDFATSGGLQNLLANSLGPCTTVSGTFKFMLPCGSTDAALSARHVFKHAGGEVIFSLPNHLHGYMLVTSAGQRLDTGPGQIVTDPDRSDKLVTNGVSCMRCHSQGLIDKDDQVAAAVKAAPAFSASDVDLALKIYPKPAVFEAAMQKDREAFAAAMIKLGLDPSKPDPVTDTVKDFENDLDMNRVAFEFGVSVADFQRRLNHSPNIGGQLAGLISGGKIKRSTFNSVFFAGAQEMNLGTKADISTVAQAAIPVANVPPVPAPSSTTGAATCAGKLVGGFCWYLANSKSCTYVCASHGGYSQATASFAGEPGGTIANCTKVLDALEKPYSTTADNYDCSEAGGCIFSGSTAYRCTTKPTTAESSVYIRPCACVN